MSTAELFRIVMALLGTGALLTMLVVIVRRLNAARERALQELAARLGLEYTPGGRDFFQGSWPGKVTGSYRGHSLSLHYRNEPSMTRQAYKRANYSAMIEMAVKNPQQASISLSARPFSAAGDPFERRVEVTSKPGAFAGGVLADASLRSRLMAALTRDRLNPGRINLARSGTLVYTRGGILRSSADLAALVELLGDLADGIEAQPERNSER